MMKHRILALATVLAILLSLLPATAIATGDGTADYVAQIGEAKYKTLEAAIAAGGEIQLLNDVSISDTLSVTGTVVLDLNGKTITGTPAAEEAYAVIQNTGKLTINDSVGTGKILCDHKLTSSTSYAVNTIVNSGTLIINGGTIENKSNGSNQIGYAIDNNSTSYETTLIINSGSVTVSGSSYYDGIRLFCNSTSVGNSVIITGGSVSSIWLQNPSDGTTDKNTKDVKGAVTVTGGTVNALYLEPSSNFQACVDGGYIGKISYFQTAEGRDLTGFVTGGTFGADPTPYAATGCSIRQSATNTWSVYTPVAQVGNVTYGSLEEAVAAATGDDWVYLLKNTSGSGIVINKDVNIDFNGYTYIFTTPAVGSAGTTTSGFQILKDNSVYLRNGTLTVDPGHKYEYAILIENYADLIVEDMTLDGTYLDLHTQRTHDLSFALSIKCGNVQVKGKTYIIGNNEGAGYSFDVYKDNAYTAPVVTINTTGRITGKFEVSSGIEDNLTIHNGIFSANPSAYLAEGKIATIQNSLFYVADKPENAPNVSVDVTTKDTTTEDVVIDDNLDLTEQEADALKDAIAEAVNQEDTKQDLQNAANNLQHDAEVVGSTDAAHSALQQQDAENYDAQAEVEVQVKPYLDVTVKEYDSASNTVKLDIKALYDVVAVQKNSSDIVTASATLKEKQPMTNVPTAITITIPLPTGFAEDGETVYIYHTKDDGTLYIHKATVSVAGGVTTATFVNDKGFSSFEVKKTSSELQTFDFTNLNLGNNLDINFYIAMRKMPTETGNLVAKFTRTYADGRTAQTEVAFADWVVDGSYYRITYTGIAAKEMCDDVTLQIFDADTPVSIAFTESIQKYAQRLFAWDGAEAKDFKMMIGLLDYGALAQEYLNYNTVNLANSIVTQAHRNKAEEAA